MICRRPDFESGGSSVRVNGTAEYKLITLAVLPILGAARVKNVSKYAHFLPIFCPTFYALEPPFLVCNLSILPVQRKALLFME